MDELVFEVRVIVTKGDKDYLSESLQDAVVAWNEQQHKNGNSLLVCVVPEVSDEQANRESDERT